MTHSDSLASLAPALVAAQAEMEHAHKNAANPHFRSRYADLAEVIDTVRPILKKHGLAIVQIPGFLDGVVTLDTMLLHESGEWIRGTSGAPAQKMDPQGVGSAVTYLRRYSLAALCGIAQEDDDGEGASGRGQYAAPSKQNGKRAEPPATNGVGDAPTQDQLETLDRLLQGEVFTEEDREKVWTTLKKKHTKAKADQLVEWARKEKASREQETVNA